MESPTSSARQAELRRPKNKAILEDGITSASSIIGYITSSSAHGSSMSLHSDLKPSAQWRRLSLGALTAENLAKIDMDAGQDRALGQQNEDANQSEAGGPVASLPLRERQEKSKPAAKSTSVIAPVVAPQLGFHSSESAIEIRSTLDEIRSVVAASGAGGTSTHEVKTTLDRLASLSKLIKQLLSTSVDH